MAKKRDDFEFLPDVPDAPSPVTPPPVEREAPASGWKKASLFVCAKCGKTKRGQEHLAMVCRSCASLA